MKKSICLVGSCLTLLLSGCSYTKYAYPNEPMNYTIVASGDTQKASDNKAAGIASSICVNKGMQGKINGVYRVSNLRLNDVKKTPTDYIFVASKTQDYLTVIDLTCVQPIQPASTKKS